MADLWDTLTLPSGLATDYVDHQARLERARQRRAEALANGLHTVPSIPLDTLDRPAAVARMQAEEREALAKQHAFENRIKESVPAQFFAGRSAEHAAAYEKHGDELEALRGHLTVEQRRHLLNKRPDYSAQNAPDQDVGETRATFGGVPGQADEQPEAAPLDDGSFASSLLPSMPDINVMNPFTDSVLVEGIVTGLEQQKQGRLSFYDNLSRARGVVPKETDWFYLSPGDRQAMADWRVRSQERAERAHLEGKQWSDVPRNFGEIVGQMLVTVRDAVVGAAAGGFAGGVAGGAAGLFTGPGSGVTLTAGAGLGAKVGANLGAFRQVFFAEGGLAMEELRQATTVDGRQPLTDAQILGAGTLIGAVNGAIELIGLHQIGKVTGLTGLFRRKMSRELLRRASQPGFRRMLAELGKRTVKAAGIEVLQENAQELVQMVITDWTKQAADEGFRTLSLDDVVSTLGEITYKTLTGVIPLVGAGSVIGVRSEIHRAQAAIERQQYFAEVHDMVGKMPLRDEAPDVFAQWVRDVAEHDQDAPTHVYFDREAVRQGIEAAGADYDTVAQALPSWQEDLTGEQTNADIVMPLDEFTARVAGTDLYELLSPHARPTADALSLAEQMSMDADTVAQIREAMTTITDENAQRAALAAAAAAESEAAIAGDVAATLESGGFAQGQDALLLGELTARITQALARGGGLDVRALWRDLGLIVRTGEDAEREAGIDSAAQEAVLAARAPVEGPAATSSEPASAPPEPAQAAEGAPEGPEAATTAPESAETRVGPAPRSTLGGGTPVAVDIELPEASAEAAPDAPQRREQLPVMVSDSVLVEPGTGVGSSMFDPVPVTAPEPGVPSIVTTDAEMVGAAQGHVLDQTVYHGTPHVFEAEDGAPFGRFRLHENAGMGEGHWMFGWGAYLAEAEEVGKSYQAQLGGATPVIVDQQGTEWRAMDEFIDSIPGIENFSLSMIGALQNYVDFMTDFADDSTFFGDLLTMHADDAVSGITASAEHKIAVYEDRGAFHLRLPSGISDLAAGLAASDARKTPTFQSQNVRRVPTFESQEAADAFVVRLKDLMRKRRDDAKALVGLVVDNVLDARVDRGGALYKIEIDPAAEELVLDGTLGEGTVADQSPRVEQILLDSVLPVLRDYAALVRSTQFSRELDRYASVGDVYDLAVEMFEAYEYENPFAGTRWVPEGDAPAPLHGHPKKDASLWFKSLGIVGRRYLDQFSRARDDDKTSNWVIWDDSVLSVLERDGEIVPRTRTLGQSAVPDRKAAHRRQLSDMAKSHPRLKNGRMMGAPRWVVEGKQPNAALADLYQTFLMLADEGAAGRYWYEQSARKALQVADGNVHHAELLLQLFAIYSPQSQLRANTNDAIDAFTQWKSGASEADFHVRPYGQAGFETLDDKARAVLYHKREWNGRKTNSFYLNLMSEFIHGGLLTPEQVDALSLPADVRGAVDQATTVDLWMRRVAGYDNDSTRDDGSDQTGTGTVIAKGRGAYSFMEHLTRNMADFLTRTTNTRWTPHQVQAAVWVGAKMRWEDPTVKQLTKKASVAAGLSTMEGGRWTAPKTSQARIEHLRIWRDAALAEDFDSERLDTRSRDARFSYATELDALTRIITYSTRPSVQVDPLLAGAPLTVQEKYAREQASLLTDDDGGDVLAELLGVPLNWRRHGAGGYQGDIEAGTQEALIFPKQERKSKPATFDDTVAQQYARAVQWMYSQEAVPYFRVDGTMRRPAKPWRVQVGDRDGKPSYRYYETEAEAQAAAKGRPVDQMGLATFAGEAVPRAGSHGALIELPFRLDHERIAALSELLVKHLGEDAAFTQMSSDSISIFNFTDDETGVPFARSDAEFEALIEALQADLPGADVGWVDAQTNYGPVHDWTGDPDGKALEDSLRADLPPGVFEWVQDRRQASERLRATYHRQLETDPTGESIVRADLAELTQDITEGTRVGAMARRLHQSRAGPHGQAELSDEQIEFLMEKHGRKATAWGDGKTRGFVVRMPIDDFLALTALDPQHEANLRSGEGPQGEFKMGPGGAFDPAQFESMEGGIMPHLGLDGVAGKVTAHEGRHRAAAAQRAGASTVPVFISIPNRKGSFDWKILYGQFQSTYAVLPHDPVPLMLENRERVKAEVGDGSAPDHALKLRDARDDEVARDVLRNAASRVPEFPELSTQSDFTLLARDTLSAVRDALRGGAGWETGVAQDIKDNWEVLLDQWQALSDADKKALAEWGEQMRHVPVFNTIQWLERYVAHQFAIGKVFAAARAAEQIVKPRAHQWAHMANEVSFEGERVVEFQPEARRLQQPAPNTPRAQVDLPHKLGDRATVVRLFRTADASSFIHEMGHTFLLMFEYAANRPSATKGMRRDWATILDWMGARDGIITDDMHEQWARGFERYLYEGKAPNEAMRSPFSQFARWLGSIYRSVQDLNVELTDDVRDVMGRLLAADTNLDAARAQHNIGPLFTDAASSGMTASQWERYQRVVMAQEQDAEQTMRARVMEDLAVQQRKEWKDAKTRVKREVRAQLEVEPVHRLHAHILGNGPPVPDGFPQGPMSGPMIRERFGDEAVERLRENGRQRVYTNRVEGLDPDAYAWAFGYSSSAAMLDELSTTPTLDAHVDEVTEQRLREEFPDPFEPIDPFGAAVEAQMNARLTEQLTMEARAIARSGAHQTIERTVSDVVMMADHVPTTQEDRDVLAAAEAVYEAAQETGDAALIRRARERVAIAKAVVKAGIARRKASAAALQRTRAVHDNMRVQQALVRMAAEQAVGRMTVAQTARTGHLLAGIRRAQKRAEEAFTAGDSAAALAAKHEALLQSEIYRAALEAQEWAGKVKKRWARYKIPAGKWNAGFVDAFTTLLEKFTFKRSKAADQARWKDIQAFNADLQKQGVPVELSAVAQAAMDTRPFDTLTMDDARQLHESLRSLVTLANLDKQVSVGAERAQLDAVLGELRDRMRLVHGMPPDELVDYSAALPSTSMLRSLRETWSKFDAAHLQPEFIFDAMDGALASGPWHRFLFEPIQKASDSEAVMLGDAAKSFKKLIDKFDDVERGHLQNSRSFTFPGVRHTVLTRENILAMALNQGNPYNKEALVEGESANGWTQEFVDHVLDTLSKRDWDFVQGVWDWVDSYWDQSRELQRRMTGLTPQKVAAEPVKTRFGTLRGGYYPLHFDPARAQVVEHREAKDNVMDMFGGNWARAQTRQGHLEARQGSGGLPVLLGLHVAQKHVHNVIHDITHREAVWSVNKLLRNDEVRAYITNVLGEDGYKQLPNWLSTVASSQSADALMDDPNAWALAFKRNFTVVAMGAKLTTALLQPLGFSQSVAFFDQTFQDVKGTSGSFIALDGLHHFYDPLTGGIGKKVAQVHALSKYMYNRAFSLDRDLHEFMQELRATGRIDTWRAMLFKHIQIMDAAVTYPTWFAGYRQGLRSFRDANGVPDEARAVAFADQAVRMSQGSGLLANLPRIMRGGALSKLLTAFMTYFSAYHNMSKRGRRLRRSKSAFNVSANMHAGYQFLLLTVLPVLLGDMLLGRGPDPDDDDDPWWSHWGKKVALYPFMGRVVVRDAANAFASGYGYAMAPFGEVVEQGVRTLSRIGGAAAGDDEWNDMINKTAVKDSLYVIGSFTGIFPAAQLWLTGNYLNEWSEGNVESFSLYEMLVTGKDTAPLTEQISEAMRR